MGFLGLVRRKGLFGITWGTPGADSWDFARRFSHGLELGTSGAVDKPYAMHSVVATAISTFVADAASVGWELYHEGDQDDKIEEHPLLDFFDRPGPSVSGHQLWVGTYLSMKLWGEAFWYFPQLSIGTPRGLRASRQSDGSIGLLDPRRVFTEVSGSRVVWRLRTTQGDVVLDEDSLTHFKRPNPYDQLRGLSELDSIQVEIEGDIAAAGYNRRFFRDQGGVPAGFLIPSETSPATPDKRKEFEDRMNRDAQGARRFVATIPPGWQWQDIGISPRDMEFRALREYSREQILAVFGVPPFMAGVLDKANYANAREQRETYWLGTITRFLTGIQATLNADFLPKAGVSGVEIYPCWETVKALTENLSEKVTIAAQLFAMGWPKRTINERLELGLDVDNLEDADVGYIAFNVMPVSMVLEPPPAPAALPPADEDEEEDAEKGLTALPDEDARERARTLIWRNLVVRVRDIELRFNSVIRKHMRDLEQEVLENLNGIKGWRAMRTKAEGDADSILFDLAVAIRSLIRLADPLHRQALKRGGESIFADLGVSIDFSLNDPRAIARIAELSGKIARVDRTIEATLRESLAEGLRGGESIQQLAKRVREAMEASRARSMTIARTETGSAFNAGRQIAMQEAGVEAQEWVTARDTSVRETHRGLDREVARIGEPFSNGLMYPQDPTGPASEIINCRCVALPVLKQSA